ncbi:MAG: hypothetical protein AB7O50_03420 [Pseudolabrys sp.]
MPLLFRILFIFDILIALVVFYFFAVGLNDGSVSSFNISLWLGMLATIGGILGVGYALNVRGHRVAANIVLAILAAPGAAYAAFILLILITQPNWR